MVSSDKSVQERLTVACSWSVIDIGARYDSFITSNSKRDAWQSGRARISVAALGAHIRCTWDLGVISADNGRWQIQERCPGIGDGID